ncbi:hypothetical protein DERP_005311 [Dermatophagoides pteronyssinus]|uniref:Uncharacterized protein n=1 Tax=Dermatophagoides pteronyssinus TaxID=6956 RepID=A0ABQ8JN07_DERPT|nr:hypothetical protein DERP_005311 [Dermatophagoides pteronyssinus]
MDTGDGNSGGGGGSVTGGNSLKADIQKLSVEEFEFVLNQLTDHNIPEREKCPLVQLSDSEMVDREKDFVTPKNRYLKLVMLLVVILDILSSSMFAIDKSESNVDKKLSDSIRSNDLNIHHPSSSKFIHHEFPPTHSMSTNINAVTLHSANSDNHLNLLGDSNKNISSSNNTSDGANK